MLGLKLLRIKNKLTQKELAEKLNLSVKQVCNYEQGLREPKLETLIALVKFFDCKLEDLV